MYVGHKSTNLQNVPPTLCKFMSGHNFDISFHLPPQRAVARHGEEPHSRTPLPHAAATAAAFVVTTVHRSRRCPSHHHRSSRAAAHLLLSNRVATIHRDCAAAVRDRRCRPYCATSHCADSSSALASAWALTLGVGVGHCRRRRDVHGTGRLRLVCIVVGGEGGGGSVSWRCQGACVLVAAGREGSYHGSGERAVALSG